jgi:membrane protein implicated in regulation of membrane protease activity
MNVAFLILVVVAVIALAFWLSGDREDRERENRRRELREEREKAVRRRELRAERGARR